MFVSSASWLMTTGDPITFKGADTSPHSSSGHVFGCFLHSWFMLPVLLWNSPLLSCQSASLPAPVFSLQCWLSALIRLTCILLPLPSLVYLVCFSSSLCHFLFEPHSLTFQPYLVLPSCRFHALLGYCLLADFCPFGFVCLDCLIIVYRTLFGR